MMLTFPSPQGAPLCNPTAVKVQDEIEFVYGDPRYQSPETLRALIAHLKGNETASLDRTWAVALGLKQERFWGYRNLLDFRYWYSTQLYARFPSVSREQLLLVDPLNPPWDLQIAWCDHPMSLRADRLCCRHLVAGSHALRAAEWRWMEMSVVTTQVANTNQTYLSRTHFSQDNPHTHTIYMNQIIKAGIYKSGRYANGNQPLANCTSWLCFTVSYPGRSSGRCYAVHLRGSA